MFENIGGKIKTLAKTIFVINVILFAIGGLVLAIGGGMEAGYGCAAAGILAGLVIFALVAGLGFLFSWVGTFFMYGYGELIEDMKELKMNMGGNRYEIMQLRKLYEKRSNDGSDSRVSFQLEPKQQEAVPQDKPVEKPDPEKPNPVKSEKKVEQVKKDKKTLRETLEYAVKFTTDDGMIAYLNSTKKLLSQEDCIKVEELLKYPETTRSKIQHLLNA